MGKYIYKLFWEDYYGMYIGITRDPNTRYKTHCKNLYRNRHTAKNLQFRFNLKKRYPKIEILHKGLSDSVATNLEGLLSNIYSKRGYQIFNREHRAISSYDDIDLLYQLGEISTHEKEKYYKQVDKMENLKRLQDLENPNIKYINGHKVVLVNNGDNMFWRVE